MDKTDNPYLTTLRLPVKRSPVIHIVVLVMHFICLILPWLTGLTLYFKMLLMCVPAVSFCIYFYVQGRFSDERRVTMIILDSEDNWRVKINDRIEHCAKLDQSLFVHPWLTIIFLLYEDRKEVFIFTPEILDADQFRRLRVRLRFRVSEVNSI